VDAALFKEIEDLERMSVPQLRERHVAAFGEETRSFNKDFLRKRIAWRLQAIAYGDLSERARQRAADLANDADLRVRAPAEIPRPALAGVVRSTVVSTVRSSHDPRVPLPGALLVREFDGQTIVAKVLDRGFEYEGKVYKSLSAIAREATGTNWNGYQFFGLKRSTDGKKNGTEGVKP